VCEYFRRTWMPGFVEGNQCAVFSDPLFFGYTFTTYKWGIIYRMC